MAAEPTNDQLQALLTDPPQLSRSETQAEIYRLARALLTAREEMDVLCKCALLDRSRIAERDSQIAALRASLHQVFQILRGHDCAESILISAAEGAAQLTAQERDAALAEEARLREALSELRQIICDSKLTCHHPADDGGDDCGNIDDCVFHALVETLDNALSANAGKWLEGKLAEAEKRGYERGKAEENEAYEREVFRQIAEAKAEGFETGAQCMRAAVLEALWSRVDHEEYGHAKAAVTLDIEAVSGISVPALERDSLRGELEAARKSYRDREPCGHPGNFQMGDEHGHFTCVVCERDAARAGETRLREALEKIRSAESRWHASGSYSGGETWAAFATRLQTMAVDALSSTADAEKWLEERLAEAEQRGYERGKVEENEAYEREVFQCDPDFAIGGRSAD